MSLIPEDQVRLCGVGDGASWRWRYIHSLFPQARQVLDYDHCAAYLHKVAKVHDGDSVQALQWVEATLTRLYLGHVGAVLGGLRRYERNSNQMLALRCAKYNGTFNQALSVINSGYGKRKKHRMLLF